MSKLPEAAVAMAAIVDGEATVEELDATAEVEETSEATAERNELMEKAVGVLLPETSATFRGKTVFYEGAIQLVGADGEVRELPIRARRYGSGADEIVCVMDANKVPVGELAHEQGRGCLRGELGNNAKYDIGGIWIAGNAMVLIAAKDLRERKVPDATKTVSELLAIAMDTRKAKARVNQQRQAVTAAF